MVKQLMMLSAFVPTDQVHNVEQTLAAARASQVMWRPYLNGHDEQPRKKGGARPGQNIKATSYAQQEWIARHVTKQVGLTDLQREWLSTDFRATGLHGALATAVRKKLIRKLRPGVYAPGRKAVKHG